MASNNVDKGATMKRATMANISIKARLIGLVIMLILITVGTGVFGMMSTQNIVSHLKADARQQQDISYAASLGQRAQIEFKTQIQEWKNILLRGNDSAQFDKYKKRFDQRSTTVQENLSSLTDILDEYDLDTDPVDEVKSSHLTLKKKYDEALKKFDKNDSAAGKAVDSLVKGVDRPIGDAFEEMGYFIGDTVDEFVEESEMIAVEKEARTRNINIASIVVAAVASIILGLLLIRSIVNPLNQIIQVTERLAEGDMTTSIEAVGKSEISKLQHSLATMADKLRYVIRQVRTSAGGVSTSTDEISKANLELSSRTEEQAASIEETSASMEQITEKVQQNSESATQAVALANSAREKAEQGSEVAQTAVNAINEIKTSSEKVADIISVIDEIAFQTNLLALNASIEAERAGEQGRGFSVVANEVQKLAQRSADAANEIKVLIKNSTSKVEEGTELVVRSSKMLEEIVKTSNETNELVQNISGASQEQATALAQVNTTISQLEEVTQYNAAMVEQTSAASSSMNDEAKTLTKLVSFFKFEKEESNTLTEEDEEVRVISSPSSQQGQVKNSPGNDEDKPRQATMKTDGNLAPKPEADGDVWENF